MSDKEVQALRKLKNRKATGPKNIPVDAWKDLGIVRLNMLKMVVEIVSTIIDMEKMSEVGRNSTLIPIFTKG